MGGRGSGGSKNGGGGSAALNTEKEIQKTSRESTASNLKDALLRGVESDGQLRRSDFRTYDREGNYGIEIRNLGQWKDVDFDEDYDWDELSDKSHSQIKSVVDKVQKSTGRKINWSEGEKNWVSFDIE